MTLGTHAVAGALAAQLVPGHPVLGFAVGFCSHFLMDAIPHGHYQLGSKQHNPGGALNEDMNVRSSAFLLDLLKTGTDACAGLIVSLLIFSGSSPWQVFAGAVGGVLPDPLQFVYWKMRNFAPLRSLESFHVWIHAKKRFDGNVFATIAVEGGIVAAVALIGRLFFG
jgi:hypothetical protein